MASRLAPCPACDALIKVGETRCPRCDATLRPSGATALASAFAIGLAMASCGTDDKDDGSTVGETGAATVGTSAGTGGATSTAMTAGGMSQTSTSNGGESTLDPNDETSPPQPPYGVPDTESDDLPDGTTSTGSTGSDTAAPEDAEADTGIKLDLR